MDKERIAGLRIEALNAKYAGKEFAIPSSEAMEILNLAMNQLEPRVTPEMWKELGRIEAEHPLSAQDEVLTDAAIIDKIDRPGFAWENLDAAEQRNLLGSIRELLAAAARIPAVAVGPQQFDFAKLMMYPEEWDTMAYPTLESAMWETISCAQIQSAIDHERNAAKIVTPSPSLAVRDVVDARDAALEQAAAICDGISQDHRDQYKGRGKYEPTNPRRADPHADGCSDGANECSDAIRALKSKPNADCSSEPANCPDNEGYGYACDPMNKAGSVKP